ncbi:MAG: hypothetical protein WDZ35_10915 [Crocinitomicaceae bacterium]
MPTKEQIITSLLIKVEAYSKTNYELLKLKTVDKTANIASRLLSRMLLLIALSFFGLFINIGLSFWVGELLGEVYYGFAVVAGFYALISIALLFTHQRFIRKIKDRIISHLLH